MRLLRSLAYATAMVVCAARGLRAQSGTTITGRVTNEAGVPLPSATVAIPALGIRTSTNGDGSYTLVVPASRANGQSLPILARVIGYTAGSAPVILAAGSNVSQNFALVVNPLHLDEVVVTGAGTSTSRERLTTTINTVDSAAITRASSPQNLVSALAAQAPNVEVRTASGEPGSSASIKIRGATSLNGTNQPLFVVDGQPVDNQTFSTQSLVTNNGTAGVNNTFNPGASTVAPNRMSDLNPGDIESIQILKSAAAAAIYGARAANGVVLITTKSGHSGATRYNLNSSWGFDHASPPDILQHVYTQGAGGVDGFCSDPDCVALRWSYGPKATAGQPMYNHETELFDTGITADNNLQISGGNDRTTFFASGGMTSQNGYLKGPNNKYNRGNLRLKGTQQVTSSLRITGNLAYNDSRGRYVQKGSNLSGLMLGALRTPPSFNNADTYNSVGLQRTFRYPNPSSVAAMQSGVVYYDNPFFVLANPANKNELGRSVSNLNAEWTPLDWLEVKETLGADYWTDWRLEALPVTSGLDALGNVTRNDLNNLEIDHNLIATAKHTLGSLGDFTLTVGQNLNSRRFRQTYTFGEQLVAPLPYNEQNTIAQQTTEYRSLRHIEAYFGQIEMSMFDQLVVNLGLRNDGFSTFGASNQRANYPKASAAWTFSNLLNHGDRTGILSFGKLHVAYGETGKEPPAYASATVLSSGIGYTLGGWGDALKSGINGQGALGTATILGNPNLRPERNRETEFGADLALLNNRAEISATYYNKRGSDLILSAPIDAAGNGALQRYKNAATITNKGVELMLNLHPLQAANAQWDLGVQFGRNRGMVTSLAGAQFIAYTSEGFTGAAGSSTLGYAPGVIRGADFLRCGNGSRANVPGLPGTQLDIDALCGSAPRGALFLGPNGLPIPDPVQRVIGDPNPKYTMSYSSQLKLWDKLTLSGLVDVRKGGRIWNGTRGILNFFGTSSGTLIRDRTDGQFGKNFLTDVYPTVGGPGAGVVAFKNQQDWENWFRGNGGGFGPVSAQFMEDGSFAKFRELSLQYDLGDLLRSSGGFTGATVRIAGRNLKTWTRYRGFDPESNLGGAEWLTQGIDYFNNPQARSFILSISLTH